jgi:hypothetical protein
MRKKDFKLEKALQIKKYLPIMEKKKLIIDIIASCTDDISGFIDIDRFQLHVYFNMMVLQTYTNLEIDDFTAQYDELCERGAMSKIIHKIQEEYDVLDKLLHEELRQLIESNSIEAQLPKIISEVKTAMDSFDVATLMQSGLIKKE